ncbi:hypothetical protein HDV57DRAFT_142511 [Trichoderma longibrachiatum]
MANSSLPSTPTILLLSHLCLIVPRLVSKSADSLFVHPSNKPSKKRSSPADWRRRIAQTRAHMPNGLGRVPESLVKPLLSEEQPPSSQAAKAQLRQGSKGQHSARLQRKFSIDSTTAWD